MAKKPKQAKKTQSSRGTNWFVIGGVAVVGIIALFALLYLALREPETQSLADYCEAADGNCVFRGDSNAPVTIVEVSDFGCSHCRNFHQTKADLIVQRYVEQGFVRWISVPFALAPATVPATNASLCANEQGQYFEFSSTLFNYEPPEEALTRDGFQAVGEEIGLEMETFNQCMEEGRYNNKISTNQQATSRVRVNSTPTFFVNDEIIRGNVPLEEFERRFSSYFES